MTRTVIASVIVLSLLVLIGCEANMESDYSSGSARSVDADIRATRINTPTMLRSLDRRDDARRGNPGF